MLLKFFLGMVNKNLKIKFYASIFIKFFQIKASFKNHFFDLQYGLVHFVQNIFYNSKIKEN
jgi:hypothetical protein